MVARREVIAADGEAGFAFWRNPKHGGAGWFGTREILLNSRETNWVNPE